MNFISLDNFTPIVIAMLIVMMLSFILALLAKKISSAINKKRQGDYTIAIKTIALIIALVCSLIIIFTIRG